MSSSLQKLLLSLFFLLLPVGFFVLWNIFATPKTLETTLRPYQSAGQAVLKDLKTLPALPLEEKEDTYILTDTTDGIDIVFNNQKEAESLATEETPKLSLSFPKDYTQPLEVKLDEKRRITLQDKSDSQNFTASVLSLSQKAAPDQTFLQNLIQKGDNEPNPSFLAYTSEDQRKTILYTFQKDQATGEKKLKNWTLYQKGNGLEEEQYQIENAKVRINETGAAEVFYFGEEDLKNQEAQKSVEPSLLERAQKTLAQEMGEDILNGKQTPDFTIPKPFFYDRNGEKHEAEWKWNEEDKTLSLSITADKNLYPLALDPTLAFTAPGQSNTGSVIVGETSSQLGVGMTAGDLNADGKTDLAVGAYAYSSFTGRAYIFYNDGAITSKAVSADVIITGEGGGFGETFTAGDLNADGKIDLVVNARSYSAGRTYIFYNDGLYPTSAASADVIIDGEVASDYFGSSFAVGDFNTDGETDLAVGAYRYSTYTGRVYIFYNDGSYPAGAASADVIITGETTNNRFGIAFASVDLNTDSKTDLVVGAHYYSSNTGRAYIFYNDGSIPTTAATADVIITGETTNNYFGDSFTVGDFNNDGRTDFIAGAFGYSSTTGRAYIFYNDGSIPTTAATADVLITGEATSNYFGVSFTSGDFNADGRTDFSIGSYYSSNTGRAYIFYNDGSIPTAAATADVIITGETTSNYLGQTFTSGDFNTDGKIDIAIGAFYYSSTTGRVYIFYSQNGQVNTNKDITGESASSFGYSAVSGDMNADGKIDLIIGAYAYSTNTGRVYIFYNDGTLPTTATSADVIIAGDATNAYFGQAITTGDFNADGETDLAVGRIGYSTVTGQVHIFYNDGSYPATSASADVTITGETTSNYFGSSLASGDFNADGKTDLAVGAYGYSSNTGRAYIFYNDGSIPTTAATADVIITGEATSDYFSYGPQSLLSGDFNADGKIDLVVGAMNAASNGRAYIFYNDGSIPTTAATADVIITGNAFLDYFGWSLTAADLNADGNVDLVVGAYYYSSNTGRAYIFHNDGSYPTGANSADVIITGESGSQFGFSFASGDFNADGRTDLAVGEYASTGHTYIFYNDGSIPTTAATANTIITGESSSYFGWSLVSGDFNADGRTDLAVGAYGYSSSAGRAYIYETRENFAWQLQRQADSSGLRTGINGTGQELKVTGETSSYLGWSLTSGDFNADGKTDLAVGARGYSTFTGRAYIFYNDGSLTTAASSADVIITGESGSQFGSSLASGDFNADGKTDLVVGAYGYSSNTGRAYIFYNDGSIPTTAATADVIITGETTNNYFGKALVSGDFNVDGKTDIAVGAYGYSSNTGRAYIFYNDGSIPTTAASADVIITGGATSNYFGASLTSGDFNADGKQDLAVGAYGYSSSTGRAYIFYNDGSIPTTAATADVIITGGATSNYFGASLTSGDFNADSRQDLAVAAYGYSTNTGRVYIFYNDGSIPTTATTADVIITGETTNNYFGWSLTSGDFNADGKTDLVVGAYGYSTFTGRIYLYTFNDSIITGEAASKFGYSLTSGDFNSDGKTDLAVGASEVLLSSGYAYIFYNDSSIPRTAVTADVKITGESMSQFGYSLASGDFNSDGKIDLAISSYIYSSNAGRAYIFYNDGSIPTTAATADVIITGEASSSLGVSLTSGDFNADGRTDLAAGATFYSTNTGRAYIFYNDGSIPTTAATADVIITGETTNNRFGWLLVTGDVNADNKTDLIVSAYTYSTSTGRVYIFYNDGSIPMTAASADVIITGETGSYFSSSLTPGDFNADGEIDLAAGAYGYSSSTGRAYIFYNDGSIPTTAATADVIITGEASSNFGNFLISGDLNADGKTDLAVGAYNYSSSAGRAYIFHNDGSIPTTAATADVIITGESSSSFGISLVSGDFNADGKTDLAVGAYGYSSSTGRVYIFTTEAAITGADAAVFQGTSSFTGTVKFE